MIYHPMNVASGVFVLFCMIPVLIFLVKRPSMVGGWCFLVQAAVLAMNVYFAITP